MFDQVAIIDENGNRTVFEYDLATNWLKKETSADPDGAGPLTSSVTTYEYDAAGNQTKVTDARGYFTQNEYDAMGRLKKTIAADPDGTGPLLSPIMQYEYDRNGNQIAMIDPLGRRTESVYDSRDRLLETRHPDGTVTQVAYDADNNSTGDIDGRATRSHTVYDGKGRRIREINALGQVTRFVYDGADQLVAQIDALGNVTRYVYDELGRQIEVIDAQGNRTRTEYDKNGNVVAEIDANGNRTEYVYDQRDRRIKVIDANNTVLPVAQQKVTVTEYDKVGNVIQETDPLGRVTRYTYDNLNRQIATTDARNKTSTTKYDVAGNVVESINALGHSTKYTYDALNRQIAVTDPLLNISRTEYDAAGNVTAEVDALGRRTEYRYDAQNRRTQVIDALGYTSVMTYDASGNLTSLTDASNKTTQFRFDPLNRQIAVIDSASKTISQTTYDVVGNVLSETDALGHITRYTYDPLNRQIEVIDASNQVTQKVYDAVGNIWKVIDPNQNTTTYTYDAIGQLKTETNQLGKTRSYTYDAVGNQIQITDRNGRTRAFIYDELNRQTQEQWLDSLGNPTRHITYSYDDLSRLIDVSDPSATYHFEYDANDRLTQIFNKGINGQGTPGFPNVTLTYTFDAVGNILSVRETVNGQIQGTTAYTYDALNRVAQITQSGTGTQNKRVNLSYNSLGQIASLSRYSDLNGTQLVTQSTYTYDSLNRLKSLTHAQPSASTPTAFYQFDYDEADRIRQIIDVDGTSGYTFDATDQLVGANHTSAIKPDEGYIYDANGNRTNVGYQTGLDNQLLSDGIYNYTYDDEGNLTRRTEIATGKVRDFVWDYRNRLISVVDRNTVGSAATQQVDYVYDPQNQRIAKVVDLDGDGAMSPTTTQFVYDRGNVLLEFTGTPIPSVRYLHGPEVDQVLAQEVVSTGSVVWHLTDHLGTVRDLVNNSGTVVNHFTYDSFGQILSQTSSTVDTRYKFTGREFDAEIELYYYRARYYDAKVGRFIGQDPLKFAAGDANLYRYVANEPLSFTDPSGLKGKLTKFKRTIKFVKFPSKRILTATSSLDSRINPYDRNNRIGKGKQFNFTITSDKVSATIAYSPVPGAPYDVPKELPGGVIRGAKGTLTEARGHIVPHIFGGSDKNVIRPFEDNFFSQNASINSGGYRVFADRVDARFEQAYKWWTGEEKEHQKRKCIHDIPQKPFLTWDVELSHGKSLRRGDRDIEQKYPLRPQSFTVVARIQQPATNPRFKYAKIIEGGSLFVGVFSNAHSDVSEENKTWLVRRKVEVTTRFDR